MKSVTLSTAERNFCLYKDKRNKNQCGFPIQSLLSLPFSILLNSPGPIHNVFLSKLMPTTADINQAWLGQSCSHSVLVSFCPTALPLFHFWSPSDKNKPLSNLSEFSSPAVRRGKWKLQPEPGGKPHEANAGFHHSRCLSTELIKRSENHGERGIAGGGKLCKFI